MKSLRTKKLDPRAELPRRAHGSDAGLDLHALETTVIAAGGGARLRTGIALEISPGFVGMVADRSSLASRGLKTAGGIIDAGYRGEIQVVVRNLTPEAIRLEAGERIAQLLVIPVALPEIEELPEGEELGQSSRAAGGFGSTGR